MTSKKKPYRNNPLLILGWDGAEWSAINRLCDQGYMPHFKSFKERGLPAHIASLQPMISPLLWTSVVTGKRAHVHGILGFVENSLEGPQAISSYQRKCPALWNILSEAGLLCQVLNWWPSNPAEEILGDFISNLAFAEGDLAGQCWPPEWHSDWKLASVTVLVAMGDVSCFLARYLGTRSDYAKAEPGKLSCLSPKPGL